MLFCVKISIIMIITSVFELVWLIERVEKIKPPQSTTEIRLVYELNRNYLNSIRLLKFNDFKKIKLWDFNVSSYRYLNTSRLIFVFLPDSFISLDRSFDFSQFKSFNHSLLSIKFIYVNGFDVNSFQLSLANDDDYQFNVLFYQSYFRLVKNDKTVTNVELKNLNNIDSYFGQLNNLHFKIGTKYTSSMSILIFKNVEISQIYLNDLTRSFIKQNILEFEPVSSSSSAELNCTIRKAWFQFYKYKLTRRILNEQIFANMQNLVIKGEISHIDPDLFKNFRWIIHILLRISNIRMIFNQGIEWILSVNEFLNVDLTNSTQVVDRLNYFALIQTYEKENLDKKYKFETPYLYPDEDFCWFVKFPFQNLVFLDPHTVCVNNCSCTQYWLLQYVYYIKQSDEALRMFYDYFSNDKPFKLEKYEIQNSRCNFTDRILNCKLEKTQPEVSEVHSTFFHALVVSQYVDFASVILLPVIGTLGMVTNIINIRVISKIDLSKTPEDKQQLILMRFMLVYSIINLIFCLIHSLSFVSKCVDLNSIYCPEFYYTEFAQYFKIIFVEFIGAILKSYSNVAYFCISLNRYILLEKDGSLAVLIDQKVSKFSKKTKIIWTIVIALLLAGLNSHKLIIYKVLSTTVFNLFYDIYPWFFFSLPLFVANSNFYQQTNNYDLASVTNAKSTVYEVFTFVNFVLNDIVLFFIFTLLDILLAVSFKRSTEKKKALIQTRFSNSELQKEKLNQLEQAVANVSKVIIINTVLLLMVKSFDIFISISKFKIWKQGLVDTNLNARLNGFCHLVKICSAYEELVKIAYMVCYCFSTISFYYLNRNFRIQVGTLCASKPKTTIETLIISMVPVNKQQESID